MRTSLLKYLIAIFVPFLVSVATAAPVTWTDWESQTQYAQVAGSLSLVEELPEVVSVLPMSNKLQTLLAKAEAGTLNKKQKKKFNKLENKYNKDMKSLSLSDSEKDGLGKKGRKRLK